MFLYILLAVLLGAALHIGLGRDRSLRRAGELGLVWLLAGYCGVPMLGFSLLNLVHPHEMAHWLGFPPDNPFQTFMTVAYLGMSLIAILALRYRGTYVVGPAVLWAVFFAGATVIHLSQPEAHGGGHGFVLYLLATHGLIAVLLVAALVASGTWRRVPD